MAHKFEHVSTGNGFSVINSSGEKVQVIDSEGNWVGANPESSSPSSSVSPSPSPSA